VQVRIEHLRVLEEIFGNVYPSKFERSRISGREDTITNLLNTGQIVEIVNQVKSHIASLREGEKFSADLKNSLNEKLRSLGIVRIAGRLTTPPRVMGKAAFVHLSDGVSRLQVYFRKGDFTIIKQNQSEKDEGNTAIASVDADTAWKAFQMIDHGDFIGVEGFLFLTNTGELTVHVEKFQFLAKALLPMPDKMHGIADPELRQRRRYVDLIASSLQVEHEGLTTRQVFERRAKIISSIRRFLDENGYIEVETPMLTPIASGAAARPFVTHHNALDIDLYARIAPELYLKRLLVGGFEKVYELGRNFRNEGISYRHNPEFTMLEFYIAYKDYDYLMSLTEELFSTVALKVLGSLKAPCGDYVIDFTPPCRRIPMIEALKEKGVPDGVISNYEKAFDWARSKK
ncbi:MAG: amino acid--tRNA ligase-related protein, partial [Pyrinomonadaceae bacterium]